MDDAEQLGDFLGAQPAGLPEVKVVNCSKAICLPNSRSIMVRQPRAVWQSTSSISM